VNNCGNQNLLCLDAVDDAIAVNEPLANQRIADLRDDPSYFWKIRNRFSRFNNF